MESVKLNPSEWESVSDLKYEIPTPSNQVLTGEIVKHIFDNLGIYATRKVSIHNEEFRLDETISISDDLGNTQSIPLWGCFTNINGNKLSLLAIEFSIDKEAALLVQLEKLPLYGAYLGSPSMIGVMTNEHWIEATLFIQASFLAGMEQMREIGSPFERLEKPAEMIKNMKTFISMYDGNE